MGRNGETVAAFEREFGRYVGAQYAIALGNGTQTLHTALVALGVKPGDRVAVPPLTMSSTTLAVLHAGAVPVFVDVDPETWVVDFVPLAVEFTSLIAVSLYGLSQPFCGVGTIDDAAQTLRRHNGTAFTSYSFQASKILSTGEGGMLVTNDGELARKAREFSSLGYRLDPKSPRIDTQAIRSPTFERHHSLGYNYRMNDATAALGLQQLAKADQLKADRQACAQMYRQAHQGCDWLTPQRVPDGWEHSYWCYSLAVGHQRIDTEKLGESLPQRVAKLIGNHGGERPYAAWRLTYQEPAFRHLAPEGTCPVAESLQPRILQFQTNDLASAERNATALAKAIREIGG